MTTYKLYINGNGDGTVYLDLPISGRIKSLVWVVVFTAGAGGIGYAHPELSRQAVNQFTTTNPRGVISGSAIATSAASTGMFSLITVFPDEPVKSGERLYLNTAGGVTNLGSMHTSCFITIG